MICNLSIFYLERSSRSDPNLFVTRLELAIADPQPVLNRASSIRPSSVTLIWRRITSRSWRTNRSQQSRHFYPRSPGYGFS